MKRCKCVIVFPVVLFAGTLLFLFSQQGLLPASADETVEALITQLRSSNADPNPEMEWGVSMPADYDTEAQRPVEEARQKLLAMGTDAFPALIEHVSDEEYSLSRATSLWRSFSVGDVCFMIIRQQVEPVGMTYKTREGAGGESHPYRGYFSQYCDNQWYTQEGLEKWWEEHQHQSLGEMQREVVQWKIQRENEIGFPDEQAREMYLQPLEEMLEELSQK